MPNPINFPDMVCTVMTENACDDCSSVLHALAWRAYHEDATQGTGDWCGGKKGLQLQWYALANFDGD